MTNAPHVGILLGKVFGMIGLWGTLIVGLGCLMFPPAHWQNVFMFSVFPVFLVFGFVWHIISKRGVSTPEKIISEGIRTQAKFTRMLLCGRHPVRSRSIYGARVELNIDGKKILSKVFFYGPDYVKVKCIMKAQQPVDVVFLASHPNYVLFADAPPAP